MVVPISSRRIVRIVGVDRVPSTPFAREHARKPVLTVDAESHPQGQTRACGARTGRSRDLVVRIEAAEAELFGGGKPELALANPIAAELSDMRPSLIPGLIMAAQRNADRGSCRCRRCSKSDRSSGATGRRTNCTAASGLRRALASRPAADVTGRTRRIRSTLSMQRPTPSAVLAAAAAAPMQALQVVPGGPPWFHSGQRHDPDRTAEYPRSFR